MSSIPKEFKTKRGLVIAHYRVEGWRGGKAVGRLSGIRVEGKHITGEEAKRIARELEIPEVVVIEVRETYGTKK